MPVLSREEFRRLLAPYLLGDSPLALRDAFLLERADLLEQLSVYLDLLLKWNARTNLTAIRDPAEIAARHLGESLFAALHIGTPGTLLDFGSGAGFPGLPIAIARPEIKVTLSESQRKKAGFLREAVRTLGLPVEVWAARVEALPADRRFDAVTMRAVDDTSTALPEALRRLAPSGTLAILATSAPTPTAEKISLPASHAAALYIHRRTDVPRGTN